MNSRDTVARLNGSSTLVRIHLPVNSRDTVARLNGSGRVVRINEPRHEIPNNVVCATSKASDQPVRTRSLIRTFAIRLNIL